MAKRYFDKFPEINYNGYNVRDLTVAAKLISKYASFPYVYDPYLIQFEQRADQVADEVYDDPYMTWMLYYANGVMDPDYDWYLPEQEFNDFLEKKYGSVPYTFKKILGFRTNWYSDSRELSPDEFRNQFGEFTAPHSYYWNPVYDYESSRLLYYVRKQLDNSVNTNRLSKVAVGDNSFSSGDLIDVRNGSATVVGTCEIEDANSSVAYVKNILGEFGQGMTLCLDGNPSVNATVTAYSPSFDPTSDVWTKTNISAEEYVYWTPFTVNDVESEANEARRSVKVVDPALAVRIADRLEEELGGRA